MLGSVLGRWFDLVFHACGSCEPRCCIGRRKNWSIPACACCSTVIAARYEIIVYTKLTAASILFRYAHSKTWQLNRITTGVIEAGRPGEVSEPYKLDTKWDFKVMMRCCPGTAFFFFNCTSFTFGYTQFKDVIIDVWELVVSPRLLLVWFCLGLCETKVGCRILVISP